jgi:hypothetical protein
MSAFLNDSLNALYESIKNRFSSAIESLKGTLLLKISEKVSYLQVSSLITS